MSNPDLARRVADAARALQDARRHDEQFAAIYHQSLNHERRGLGSILSDLTRRLTGPDAEGLPLP